MIYTHRGAHFDEARTHRYDLIREWESTSRGTALFCGLNPSTADATFDDRTIGREVEFADREGCNRLVKVNLYSFCATDPAELLTAVDPIGIINNGCIMTHLDAEPKLVVAAWGSHKMAAKRAQHVLNMMRYHAVFCLGMTKDGSPRHPLYVKGDAPLILYALGGRTAS